MTQVVDIVVAGAGPTDVTIPLQARVTPNRLATRKTEEPR
jgi:hypothetical protein